MDVIRRYQSRDKFALLLIEHDLSLSARSLSRWSSGGGEGSCYWGHRPDPLAARSANRLCRRRRRLIGMVLSPATLEVQGLSVSYGYSRAVQDVSFSIDPGRCVGIVGANGAGKSSILRSIGGLVRPSAGRILFDGHDLRGQHPGPSRVRASASFQRHGSYSPTSLSPKTFEQVLNLCAARSGRARCSACSILSTADEASDLRARVLSGGEQQMLAIGRALAGRPCLLLLDEPALGLAPTAIRPWRTHSNR